MASIRSTHRSGPSRTNAEKDELIHSCSPSMKRRTFLSLAGAVVSSISIPMRLTQKSRAAETTTAVDLLSAPLEVTGVWGGSQPTAASIVLSRMRQACLSGLRLRSDRQPNRLRVEDLASGPPHIWLHTDIPGTAWIVVHIGARAWAQLAYQFGHELGHVMCNSWAWGIRTPPPSRWFEESLVEAFSIRGLGRLADEWERDPPFPGNASYGQAIRDYRSHLIEKYRNAAGTGSRQKYCRVVARQSSTARPRQGFGPL
jgi:hypothetical protein